MAETTSVEQTLGTNEPHGAIPAAPHRGEDPAQNRKFHLLLIAGAVVLVIACFFFWRHFSAYESTDDAQVDGHINSVSARISGYVTEVNVQDNQYVEKGQVIVRIDPADYKAALDQAEAEFHAEEATADAQHLNVPITTTNTESQLTEAGADVRTAQAGISAAEDQAKAAAATVTQAEANDKKAQADLARYKELVDKKDISLQQYDQAVAAAASAAANVAAARSSLAAAQEQVQEAHSKLDQAEAGLASAHTGPGQVAATQSQAKSASANVEQKRAEVERAQLNLDYTVVVAPVSGVVNKNVEVGMNVQPGQEIVSIVPIDDVWVTADFKETQLKKMRPGQRAVIRVDAFDRDYKGHVESIAGASGSRFSLLPPENATGNYVKVVQRIPVKIVLDQGDNSDHLLRPGMSVEPRVYTK
jgi:membrane fusion protein (multidrug efflux system)